MALPSTKEERDAHLDELKTAVHDYAAAEELRVHLETQFLRSRLQGVGASNVAALNLGEGMSRLRSEVNAYLFVE